MTRSIKFFQRRAHPRCSRETLQLPITYYMSPDDEMRPILIRHVYVSRLNLGVPYLAYRTKRGYIPLEIPENIFNIPVNWRFKKQMKMQWFRRYMPRFIDYQYFIAEMIQVEGYDSIDAIDSGQVMRNLRDAIETRLKLKTKMNTWDVVPGFVPAVSNNVC